MADVGSRGERAALEVYLRRGYRLIARNWRSRIGELDLVLARDGIVVFCEVKARRGSRLGGPFEAVGPAKQRKLRALAEAFLLAHRLAAEGVRFDVASVVVSSAGPRVHVFEDAF